MIIARHNKSIQNHFTDRRKLRKMTDTAILLIEFLTEESTGVITAKVLKKKT